MVDEAHRTQEGQLGEDMRAAIPNAQFFGLTGTPIADADRNTFKLFGEQDDPGYVLNQYSMERSIAVVPVPASIALIGHRVVRFITEDGSDRNRRSGRRRHTRSG